MPDFKPSHVTYRWPASAAANPSLEVNGVDIANALGADFTVTVAQERPPRFDVQMFADDFLYDGEATLRVDLPSEVRAALIAAGWIPPVTANTSEKDNDRA